MCVSDVNQSILNPFCDRFPLLACPLFLLLSNYRQHDRKSQAFTVDICDMSGKIPKIFHQIWLNGDMPKEYQELTEILLSLHPDWEYKLWTSENRPKLFNESVYKNMPFWKFKSDLIRYEVLLREGGVYLDVDFLFQRNMNAFLEKDFIVINQKNFKASPGLTNCLMGFPKEHYVIKYLVMKIPELMTNSFDNDSKRLGVHGALLKNVGPGILYNIKGIEPNFNPVSHQHFCPISSIEIKEANLSDYSSSYAIHLWNARWGTEIIRNNKTKHDSKNLS